MKREPSKAELQSVMKKMPELNKDLLRKWKSWTSKVSRNDEVRLWWASKIVCRRIGNVRLSKEKGKEDE